GSSQGVAGFGGNGGVGQGNGGSGGHSQQHSNGGGCSPCPGSGGEQGGNGGQFGGGRDPAVVEACTTLTDLLRQSDSGPLPASVAEKAIRPWNHLTIRRNANQNVDAHRIDVEGCQDAVPAAALI